jgi:hypothetical protein
VAEQALDIVGFKAVLSKSVWSAADLQGKSMIEQSGENVSGLDGAELLATMRIRPFLSC